MVILVAIGTGAKDEIERQISGLGTNIILVVPGRISLGAAPTQSKLGLADVAYVRRVVGDPSKVTVSLQSGETVRVGRAEAFVTVIGTDQNLVNIFERPVGKGRPLSETDVDTRRRVAVLGSEVAGRVTAALRERYPGEQFSAVTQTALRAGVRGVGGGRGVLRRGAGALRRRAAAGARLRRRWRRRSRPGTRRTRPTATASRCSARRPATGRRWW